MRKKREKSNKKTLQKKIVNTLSVLNFNSMLVMLILMLIILGFVVKFFSIIVTHNAAQQMKNEINEKLRVTPELAQLGNNSSLDDELFKRLGYSYCFLNDEEFKAAGASDNPMKNDLIKEFSTVRYRIWKDGKIIFTSKQDLDSTFIEPSYDNSITNLLNFESTVSVSNSNDYNLKIGVKINPVIIILVYVAIILVCLFIFMITLIISQFFARKLSRIIVKPLGELEDKMNQLAEGNIEAAMNSELLFKNPIKEVESLSKSTNKIISKVNEYVITLEKQNDEFEAQNLMLEENGKTLKNINNALEIKNNKINNILDNVEQGFFIIDDDLIIKDEYSLECKKIFNKAIDNINVASLLYPEDNNMKNFLQELLRKIFNSDNGKKKLYIPLLPEEVKVGEKIININYKMINESKKDMIMVILTDISEKRILEKKMDDERKVLKMIIKTIINRNEFLALTKEYEAFASREFTNLDDKSFEEVLREIHTFKGNFSQYEMINIAPRLEELENKLYGSGDAGKSAIINNDELMSYLALDLQIIKTYVGNDFFTEDEFYYVKKTKLNEIENKLKDFLSEPERKVIIPLIRSLSFKSVKELLNIYPDYLIKLSDKLGKSIKPMKITGDDVLVDASLYQKVIKSLVHIFRNSADHGIETEDERYLNKKELIGSISCTVKDLKDSFQIIIKDDGKGIDTDSLGNKAVKMGLITESELEEMDESSKMDLIFLQGITTKEKATAISGRGVGMSAVKEAITEIGGNIKVQSQKGIGSSFIITLPRIEEPKESLVDKRKFINAIMETSRDFLQNQIGINVEPSSIEAKNKIALNWATALISFNGTMNSIIMISVNEAMAKKLVNGFVLGGIKEEEIIQYVEDVLGEVSNTILGNTFGKFDEADNVFNLGIPAMICNNGAYVKYTEAEILTCALQNDIYDFSISMLLTDDIQNNEEGV